MTDGTPWTRWPPNAPTLTPRRASNTSDTSFRSVSPAGEHVRSASASLPSFRSLRALLPFSKGSPVMDDERDKDKQGTPTRLGATLRKLSRRVSPSGLSGLSRSASERDLAALAGGPSPTILDLTPDLDACTPPPPPPRSPLGITADLSTIIEADLSGLSAHLPPASSRDSSPGRAPRTSHGPAPDLSLDLATLDPALAALLSPHRSPNLARAVDAALPPPPHLTPATSFGERPAPRMPDADDTPRVSTSAAFEPRLAPSPVLPAPRLLHPDAAAGSLSRASAATSLSRTSSTPFLRRLSPRAPLAALVDADPRYTTPVRHSSDAAHLARPSLQRLRTSPAPSTLGLASEPRALRASHDVSYAPSSSASSRLGFSTSGMSPGERRLRAYDEPPRWSMDASSSGRPVSADRRGAPHVFEEAPRWSIDAGSGRPPPVDHPRSASAARLRAFDEPPRWSTDAPDYPRSNSAARLRAFDDRRADEHGALPTQHRRRASSVVDRPGPVLDPLGPRTYRAFRAAGLLAPEQAPPRAATSASASARTSPLRGTFPEHELDRRSPLRASFSRAGSSPRASEYARAPRANTPDTRASFSRAGSSPRAADYGRPPPRDHERDARTPDPLRSRGHSRRG
jgi:hypothetical protein